MVLTIATCFNIKNNVELLNDLRKIQLMILIAFIVFYNKLVKAIIGENKMNKVQF